jgi:competence protein ComEC
VVDWRRARGRASTGSRTWPEGRPEPRRALAWTPRFPDIARSLAERLAPWLAAEVAPGRLMPWLPVAFGSGIAIYFAAEREPAWWAALALAAALGAVAIAAYRRPVAFPALLAAAAVAAGFATATLRTLSLAHPILRAPAYGVSVAGFVEAREEREKTDRIVIRVHAIEAQRLDQLLERVRLSVKKGTAPPVGSYVSLKARLSPPLRPLRPGGYDFARDLFFQGIGASGFASGAITIETPPEPPGLRLKFATVVEGIRDAVDARIRATVKGDAGAIASALLTGKRDALSQPVNDAMYISSLAHVLSISGYHMCLASRRVQEAARA